MTATALFDVVARTRSMDPERSIQLVNLAKKLVSSALADLERLREYEQQVSPLAAANPHDELELLQSVWDLYARSATEAEQIFQRARSLKDAGINAGAIAQLNDAIGHVQARLSVKPEQIANAKRQARQGQFIPAKELRDELNARLRT